MASSSYNDITRNSFVQRITPEYDANEPVIKIQFANEMELNTWYANVASNHAHWIRRQTHVNKRNVAAVDHMSEEALKACLLPKEKRYFICDHGRTKAVKKEANDASTLEGIASVEASNSNGLSNEVAIKKRRVTKKPSIKVNCPAKITQTILFNGNVSVEYQWQHASHNPLATLDLASSRLPKTIKHQTIIEEQEQQRLLHVNTLVESVEQAYAILGVQIKELNNPSERDPDLLESILQDIKNLTSKIEITRNSYPQRS